MTDRVNNQISYENMDFLAALDLNVDRMIFNSGRNMEKLQKVKKLDFLHNETKVEGCEGVPLGRFVRAIMAYKSKGHTDGETAHY